MLLLMIITKPVLPELKNDFKLFETNYVFFLNIIS